MLSRTKTIILLSYLCIASISAAILTPALPMIEQSYHLSHGSVEWVMTIFLMGYTLGQLIYGPLSVRFSSLWALRCGLLINILGIILCIISETYHSYYLLLIGRLITALGAASGLTCTFSLIHSYFSKKQSILVLSFSMVSFTLGIGAAIAIGGLITEQYHWGDCFYVLLAHGILMWLLTWLLPSSSQETKAINFLVILKKYIHVLTSLRLVGWSLVVSMPTVFSYTFTTMAPTYANQVLHVSMAHYGAWNLLNMIGMLASGFVSRVLLNRYHPAKVVILMFLTTIPALSLIIFLSITSHPTLLLFMTSSIWLYVFTGALFPAATWLASTAVKDTESASSMMSFINMLGAVVSVMLMGYVHLSLFLAFCWVFIGFFLVSGCAALFLSLKQNNAS